MNTKPAARFEESLRLFGYVFQQIMADAKQSEVRDGTLGESCDVATTNDSQSQKNVGSMVSLQITYCWRCRWGTRALWLAQELMNTFAGQVEIVVTPGESGQFDVHLDGELVFSRKAQGRFPEPKELKQAVRDRVDPGRSLGHSDTPVRE